MKFNTKRVISGFLAALTIATSAIQPLPVLAADNGSEKPPSYESVKDLLDADEVVTAKDLEIEMGASFDIEKDFSNIEIPDSKKVKVTFEEAMNDQNESFVTDHEDTYKAVYYVEPQTTKHPTYQINRKIIVKDTRDKSVSSTEVSQSETQTENQSDSGGGDEESAEDGEADSENQAAVDKETEVSTEDTESENLTDQEFDELIEASETQDTVDEESGLSLSDVLLQAGEQGIDLTAMEEGETVTFTAESDAIALFSARASQNVSITRGSWYRYADYGLGSYLTAPYYVKFGNISATAYCVQPSKTGPDDGTYTVTKLSDGKTLAKVCYYGTKASGDEGFFAEKHPDFSTGKRFIITHLAAAYANGSSDAFSGANATGKSLAMELYNYCVNQPEIPDVAMSFSNANVKAYMDGNGQRTQEVTFNADKLQTITFKLPSGVKLHNVTTGKTSAAGASVDICGGTKFYLSAPITQAEDVNAVFSTTMKGSITKDYSAYKITTGGSTQDMAFVFGEGVDSEAYANFSAEWVKMATVEIEKKDDASGKNLAGAVYGIYKDAACTQLITEMPATDSKGASSVTIEKTQDVVYLKEITAPKNYVLNTSAVNVTLKIGSTTTKTVTDKEQLAELTVYKEGEMLTGATVTDDGVAFQYSKQKLKGATYNVYAYENIYAGDGSLVYGKGALVKENLTTGDAGSATLKKLHLGKYEVVETGAPKNYVNTGESKVVTLSYAGQNAETVFDSVTFTNARQKAKVSVEKVDTDTRNPLSGGKYAIFASSDIKDMNGNVIVKKDTKIETATTGNDGSATFTADLPINYGYYVKEVQAPDNYFRNSNDVYAFQFDYTNEKEAEVAFSHTFANERVDAEIQLIKVDKETGKTQGDAKLSGAVYGLYAREDIMHPDGATGVLYKAGTQVAVMETDEEGKASVQGLYLGKYYIKEISPSEGYLLDETEYDLDMSFEGDLVKTVKKTATSKEQVIKQPFQVIKAANNGKTDADLLKGAGFTAYLESSLKVNADGSYDYTSATPVALTVDGKTEMFTDAKGYACSIALPYGTYVVRETTTPHNYTPVEDFKVTISENHPNEPQIWRVLLDKEFEAKLKIIKADDETKQSVLLANTEFKIYDLDREKYVEQVTTYPVTKVHKSYFTDASGYLILPNNLKIGHYRIEEVTAPDGYTINQNYAEIQVDSNTAYRTDSVSNDVIIEAVYENHPVKGELTIQKDGEVLKGFGEDFEYEKESLKGAQFNVYASEDIYTPDHQKAEDGKRNVIYAKDTLVATVTTDENGKAVIEDLPLGKYRVEEVKAPYGFALNTSVKEVNFAYAGQDVPVVKETVSFTDERQKVSLRVEKQDAETGNVVGGAVFGIYNAESIVVDGKVIVKADTLLQKMTSDENGQAVCTLDLPLGKYYVKELEAPAGFVSSDEVLDFDASYQGQDVKVITLKSIKKNEPTIVSVTKSDITTGVELDGAYLTVLDKDNNVIDQWTSVKDEPHVIKYLVAGETYTLRETFAPYGYLKTTDVTFTVSDTAEVQPVEMKDEVPTGLLIINKKGEFLDSVTLVSKIKGIVEHIFNYITGNLTEVTFDVFAEEDIKAADGVSEDYYKAGDKVATIVTDENGIASLENLPLGKYYVKEVKTAHGYVLDEEIRHIDLTYRDQDTPVVTFNEEWQNHRQRVEVSVLKKEKGSDRVLEGGVFGLFAAEDIVSFSGEVLIEKDEIIELKTTDAEGKIDFIAALPQDAKYYVKEMYAPDGFVNSEEVQEFTAEYAGDSEKAIQFAFTFEDEPTTVEITKTALTTGKEIPGCKLKVTDENDHVVDEWTSTEEAHVIKELVVGKKYTLTETKPADGFVTAESIEFTIENTADVQKVEMKDDVTKVEISKQDISGKELPGAKLSIIDANGKVVESWTSTEEAHYIEMLPVGKYTLREESAPEGFQIAEEVEFEVLDTGKVQHVVMVDEVVPETPHTTEKTDAPKTGDETNLALWLFMLGLGVCGISAAVAVRVRRKKNK